MESWRATRPVDVARLNSGVFLAVLRKFALVVAICAPVYFGTIVLLAHLRAPQLGIGFVLDHVWLNFVLAFVAHLAFGWLATTFAVAVGSLVWWRHVLARGGPNMVLAALVAASRRVVLRLAQPSNPGVVAGLARRDHTIRAVPEHPLLDQLRCALSISSTAPPVVPVTQEDPLVRIDQLIARRIA